MSRPITIKKVRGGYHVLVKGHAVHACQSPTGEKYACWEGRAGYIANSPVRVYKTFDDAISGAHMIGRYTMQLGDFVYTYVLLEGFGGQALERLKKKGYRSV